MSFFRVRRVELVGLRLRRPRPDAGAALRIPARKLSVFDDLRPIATPRRGAPGRQTGPGCGRRLPARSASSWKSAHRWRSRPADDAMRLIDARGRMLPFDPARSAPDLPVDRAGRSRGWPSCSAGCRRSIRRSTSGWRRRAARRMTWWWRSGKALRFRPDASQEDMELVTEVEAQLAREGRKYRELDGRFAGQVIVRGRA